MVPIETNLGLYLKGGLESKLNGYLAIDTCSRQSNSRKLPRKSPFFVFCFCNTSPHFYDDSAGNERSKIKIT